MRRVSGELKTTRLVAAERRSDPRVSLQHRAASSPGPRTSGQTAALPGRPASQQRPSMAPAGSPGVVGAAPPQSLPAIPTGPPVEHAKFLSSKARAFLHLHDCEIRPEVRGVAQPQLSLLAA